MDRPTNTTICGIALLAVALVAAVGLAALPATAAVGDPMDVTIDDPDNQTIEVDVSFTGATDAEVKLVEGTDTLRNETLSGTDTETLTADLNASGLATGEYVLRVDATDESVASLADTRMVYERDVELADAANESVQVDVSFLGAENATADVEIADDTGSTVVTDSTKYIHGQHDDNSLVRTLEYNESDGLTDGNLTATTTVSPATTYDAVWVTTTGDGGGLLTGTIGGQDAETAVIAVVVILVAGYVGRDKGWW